MLYIGSGSDYKSVELYATGDIADLSAYSLGVASNGNADEIDFTFPADSVTAGEFIWVTRGSSSDFQSYYGQTATYTDESFLSFNGDDNVLVWKDGSVIDRYGVADTDGTGEAWEYSSGTIMYRVLSGWVAAENGRLLVKTVLPKARLDATALGGSQA